jgi:hypothetical protein
MRPVCKWKLNEGTGEEIHDSTDAGNKGLFKSFAGTSVPQWVEGRTQEGFALRFDGFSCVQIPNHPSLEPSSITAAAWVRSDSVNKNAYLLSKGALGTSGASYAFFTSNSGGLQFYAWSASSGRYFSPDVPSPGDFWNGEWVHIAWYVRW